MRGGGAKLPPHTRARIEDHAWYVDGREVAVAYPFFMQKAVSECLAQRPDLAGPVDRYYLHQASKPTLMSFVERAGLPKERVPFNVNRYGNTSAASTLLLFSEDLAEGRVRLEDFGVGVMPEASDQPARAPRRPAAAQAN